MGNTKTESTEQRKYAARTEQYSLLLGKYAELEAENKELEDKLKVSEEDPKISTEAPATPEADPQEAVQAATAAVKEGAESATDPKETNSVSDAAKNSLIDAVARIDSEAGDVLAEAIDAAEVVSGDKIASMVVDAINAIRSNMDRGSSSPVPGSGMQKSASRNTTIGDRLGAQLADMSQT